MDETNEMKLHRNAWKLNLNKNPIKVCFVYN